jgi:hypothetical protein
MKVNNNDNEEGPAQSAAEGCRILGRQFAYGETAGLQLLKRITLPSAMSAIISFSFRAPLAPITRAAQRSAVLWEISRWDHSPGLPEALRLVRVIAGHEWKPSSDAADRAFLERSARGQGHG